MTARRARTAAAARAGWALRLAAALLPVLAGCASGPPPPDWQLAARGALDAAVEIGRASCRERVSECV